MPPTEKCYVQREICCRQTPCRLAPGLLATTTVVLVVAVMFFLVLRERSINTTRPETFIRFSCSSNPVFKQQQLSPRGSAGLGQSGAVRPLRGDAQEVRQRCEGVTQKNRGQHTRRECDTPSHQHLLLSYFHITWERVQSVPSMYWNRRLYFLSSTQGNSSY